MSKQTMITPQGLRIGNWVHLRYSDFVNVQVVGIDLLNIEARFKGREDSSAWTYDEIEPIPLTDEIMEKCGFYHPMHDELWRHKSSCVDLRVYLLVMDGWDGYTKPWITANDNFMFPSIHCRYLHELQNCYFAVEGEELEVKL